MTHHYNSEKNMISDIIRKKLENANIRYWAGDNISSVLNEGDKEALKALAKSLKTELKVGGTVKDNTILIQGDFRDNIIACLKAMGHQVKRIGG